MRVTQPNAHRYVVGEIEDTSIGAPPLERCGDELPSGWFGGGSELLSGTLWYAVRSGSGRAGSTLWRQLVVSHLLTWNRDAEPPVWRARCAGAVRKVGEQSKRLMVALLLAVLPALIVVLSSQARHWLVEAIVTICVLGGFMLAPVLTLAAWVGMVLPAYMPLHQISTTLFAVALVWIGAALVGAHMHYGIARRRRD